MKPEKAQSIRNALTLLRQSEVGVLSTHSKACSGFPFGSVSTYLSTHEGDIIFYISDLAQHTKNLNVDDRMCLTVFASSDSGKNRYHDDPNAGARLSVLGHAQKLDKSCEQGVVDRFFKLYPDSARYQHTHDFMFYKLRCERLRFIGGFGDIHWIRAEDWRINDVDWAQSEQSMIEHMNEDHLDAMQVIYEHHFRTSGTDIEMLAINPDGYFFTIDGSKPQFIPFKQIAKTAQEVRRELVSLTNSARAALSQKAS